MDFLGFKPEIFEKNSDVLNVIKLQEILLNVTRENMSMCLNFCKENLSFDEIGVQFHIFINIRKKLIDIYSDILSILILELGKDFKRSSSSSPCLLVDQC